MVMAVTVSYLTKHKESEKHVLQEWRRFWGIFVIYVFATSVILLFVASFAFGKSVTLSDMNNWVGIILGMIALVIGIISLYLSFYNLDEANRTQQETLDILEKVEKNIDARLRELPKDTAKEVKYQMFENERGGSGTDKATIQQEIINDENIESWE